MMQLNQSLPVYWAIVAMVCVLTVCGCSMPEASRPSLAAMQQQQQSDPYIYVDDEGHTVAEFEGAVPDNDILDSLALLADDVNVAGFKLGSEGNLKEVTLYLPHAGDLGWDTAILAEFVLAPGGIVDSWVWSEATASECQLHAEVVNGTHRYWCEGECPPDFPIGSLIIVEVEPGHRKIFCICKTEPQEPVE